ncbi:MAG TPA: CPBP family intramembrane metalloprotease, partial [Pirellulaceae bacterium]|nr:CPBP family intramembrane metalloprotease [Pirellulaceae bacterium]
MNCPADSEPGLSHAPPAVTPPAAQPPDAQLSAAAPQLMSQPLDAQPPIATAQLADVPPRRPTWFRDGEGRPRTFWRLFFFSWAFLFGQIVAMIGGLIMMLVGALLVTKLRNSDAGVGGRPVEEMLNENELLLLGLTGVIAVPIALGTIWLFRRFLDRRPMMDIGFRRPVAWRWGATSGAIIGTLLMAATVGMATLAGGYRWAGLHAPWTALGLFIPLLAAAFYEELMFRGYLFRNFVEIGRTNLGIWLPSLVFWLVHGMNPNAWTSPWIGANLFLAGVLLTLACHRSGNLWFPTTLHFM